MVAQQNISQVRERLLNVEKTLNSIVIGHEDTVKALMVSLVAKEHMVMIGPPGTAKSYLVHSLSQLLNARFYKYLLTRFTDYSELFGPVDIQALSQGTYSRRWSDIIRAQIIFLDETFKASSIILNALLSLMQERVVYDSMSGEMVKTETWTVIGASNETPQDAELQALYDRFAIRVFINYLSDDIGILRALEQRWANPTNHAALQPMASFDDVKAMHEYSLQLLNAVVKQLGSPIFKVYYINVVPMVKGLRQRGILVSDRTIIEKLPKLFASYLALYGLTVDNIYNAPLELLTWTAQDYSQLSDIKKVIDESMGELAELSKKLEDAKKYVRGGNFDMALKTLDDILSFDVNRLTTKPWLKPRAEAILSMARVYKQKIEEQLEAIKRMSEELQ